MLGKIIDGVKSVGEMISSGKKQKREIEHDIEKMRFGYMKEKVTITLFAAIAICTLLPYFFYTLSPILKYIPFMPEVLKDYEEMLNNITIDRIYHIVYGLLGLGGVAAGTYAVGKVRMAEKKLIADKDIEKEKIIRGVVGDEYVKLSANEESPTHVKEFISKYSDLAVMLERDFEIPASGALAHAALETDWGRKILTGWDNEERKGRRICSNSMFNIKAFSNWEGKKVYRKKVWEQTKDGKNIYVPSWFRAYDSIKDSFVDYGNLITKTERYEKADLATDPIEYVNALHECGFQTDVNAVSSLTNIIKRYFIYET